MGWKIYEHVTRIKPRKDKPAIYVSQDRRSDTYYGYQGYIYYEKVKTILSIEGDQIDYDSILGGLDMTQFRYINVHFMGYNIDDQILHTIRYNWYKEYN